MNEHYTSNKLLKTFKKKKKKKRKHYLSYLIKTETKSSFIILSAKLYKNKKLAFFFIFVQILRKYEKKNNSKFQSASARFLCFNFIFCFLKSIYSRSSSTKASSIEISKRKIKKEQKAIIFHRVFFVVVASSLFSRTSIIKEVQNTKKRHFLLFFIIELLN